MRTYTALLLKSLDLSGTSVMSDLLCKRSLKL